ncbi:MAG TPA: hypothetical protein VFC78_22020 [Tepidisphaeraceae bacterium]|nr:hypothetical protein [Tepidisphaeraceae bacterium]
MMQHRPVSAPTYGAAVTKSDVGVTLAHYDEHALRGRFLGELMACGEWLNMNGGDRSLAVGLTHFIRAEEVTRRGEPIVSPSQSELMEVSGVGEVTARRRTQAMAEQGIISIFSRGHGRVNTVYVLHFIAQQKGLGTLGDPTALARLKAAKEFDYDILRGTIPDPSEGSESAPRGALLNPSEGSGASENPRDTIASLCFASAAAAAEYSSSNAAAACAALLKDQGFDPDAIARTVALRTCTVDRIRIGMGKADRAEKKERQRGLRPGDEGWPSRQGLIFSTVKNEWPGPPSAEDRRRAARPEHVQEAESAALIERRGAAAREAAIDAALGRLDDAAVDGLMRELVGAAANDVTRRALERIGRDRPRMSASLRALVFQRFCAEGGK